MSRIQEAHTLWSQGYRPKQIANRMGITEDAVRSYISQMNKKIQQITLSEENRELKALLEEMTEAEAAMYRPSSKDDNDVLLWRDHVAAFKTYPRMIKVQKFPDIHFPDQHDQTVLMNLQLTADFQPDVVILGDDCFDFDLLSLKFPRDASRKIRDVFKEVRPYYLMLVQAIQQVAPNALLIAIGDNHGRGRVENFINERAVMLQDTIVDDYNDLVRANRQVLWLGWQDEMRLGPVVIQHGTRAGENSPKMSMKDRGFGGPTWQSHTHGGGQYMHIAQRTADDSVSTRELIFESATTPCLCNIYPHYRQNAKKAGWVNGASFGHIDLDMQHEIATFQNRVFHKRKDGTLVTTLGAKEYQQKPERLFTAVALKAFRGL